MNLTGFKLSCVVNFRDFRKGKEVFSATRFFLLEPVTFGSGWAVFVIVSSSR